MFEIPFILALDYGDFWFVVLQKMADYGFWIRVVLGFKKIPKSSIVYLLILWQTYQFHFQLMHFVWKSNSFLHCIMGIFDLQCYRKMADYSFWIRVVLVFEKIPKSSIVYLLILWQIYKFHFPLTISIWWELHHLFILAWW